MKKLITLLVAGIAFIACGDTTTINGYTDEQVEKLLAANKDTVYQVTDGDSVMTYIYVTDTLYNEIVDTVYKMSVDTLYQTLYDTLSTTIIDTVINTLVDTVVTRVIDTVINTMVDTVYTRVIDTVFKTLENVGVDTELPRDTSITVTGVLDGYNISRTYNGVVYKGVFYDTTLYQFNDSNSTTIVGSKLKSTKTDMYRVMVDQCGAIVPPNDGLFIETYEGNTSTYKYFDGWRHMNNTDLAKLDTHISYIVPETKKVVTNVITNNLDGWDNNIFMADVATHTGKEIVNYVSLIRATLYYVCAYELK